MPYSPKPPPRTRPEFQELYDYMEQELQAISRELLGTSELELRTTSKAPARPREGMIVQADGVTWNPGEGAGTYKYEAGVWKKFGDADHVHTLADVTDAGTLAGLDSIVTGDILSVTTDRIIGRDSASTGAAEQLTLSQVLDFIGSAARGDLLARGASTWARLAVGSSGTVLKSDGTDPSWGTVSGWTSLQTNTISSGSNSDFTSISQSHKVLCFIGREMDGSVDTTLGMFFGTTSSFGAYYDVRAGNVNVSVTTVAGSGMSQPAVQSVAAGVLHTLGTGYMLAMIFDYASTSKHKVGIFFTGIAGTNRLIAMGFFAIQTTSAIEHVRFTPNSGSFAGGSIEMVGLF